MNFRVPYASIFDKMCQPRLRPYASISSSQIFFYVSPLRIWDCQTYYVTRAFSMKFYRHYYLMCALFHIKCLTHVMIFTIAATLQHPPPQHLPSPPAHTFLAMGREIDQWATLLPFARVEATFAHAKGNGIDQWTILRPLATNLSRKRLYGDFIEALSRLYRGFIEGACRKCAHYYLMCAFFSLKMLDSRNDFYFGC
jgi:hypothetical protein